MAKKEAKKSEKKELKQTERFSDKLEQFISENKKVVLSVFCAVLAVLVGYVIMVSVKANVTEKYLGVIDSVEYRFLDKAQDLSAGDVDSRIAGALGELEPFLSKSGIAGARANLLAAEIYVMKNDFETAQRMYETAASKVKNTYLYSIAVCGAAYASEQLNDFDKALDLYKKAAADKECVNPAKVNFSIGRLYETKEDYAAAKEVYSKLFESDAYNNEWAKNAKSRLIALQIEGKIE